jgi:23S rRNA (cytosine1962-C5)-methyltransferase
MSNCLDQQVVLKGMRRIRARHPWIYEGEIEGVRGDPTAGGIVDVVDRRGKFLARGYYNPASTISVRVLTFDNEPVDDEWWCVRLADAVKRRGDRAGAADGACRLVHSEGDLLPGLVVDRYGDYLVVQILTLGVERKRDLIVSCLCDLLSPRGVYERSDVRVREYEGLKQSSGLLFGDVPEAVEIDEDGARMTVDIVGGQKTGSYLDQRVNHGIVAEYARGARVLDAFCYTGGFAIRCALAGAQEVVAVDSSEPAGEHVRQVAKLNGVNDQIRVETANVFDWLRNAQTEGERFDLIVLDPPPFSRGKRAVDAALRGYKDINMRAMRLLSPSGKLATFSCSFHVGAEMLRDVLIDAAGDAGRSARIIETMTQSPDHPVLLAAVETRYLSGYVIEVE